MKSPTDDEDERMVYLHEEQPPDLPRWSISGRSVSGWRLSPETMGFDTPEAAIDYGLQQAPHVTVRTVTGETYLASRAGSAPNASAQLPAWPAWPPTASERLEIDARYEAEAREAIDEAAAENAFAQELAAWVARFHPELAGQDPAHRCLVLRHAEDSYGIDLQELDLDGQICAARARGGPSAFGSPADAVAGAAQLPCDDPWVIAVVDAVERERHWTTEGRRDHLELTLGADHYYHVTASVNRASIRRWGLDWTRMGAAPGVAGSLQPELPAVFLDQDIDSFFIHVARTTVDLWAVDVTGLWLENGPVGWHIHNYPIASERLRLIATDLPARNPRP